MSDQKSNRVRFDQPNYLPKFQQANMSNKPTILYEAEYVHVVNNETGEIELLEGPRRFQLPAHKVLLGSKNQKLVLKDNQYVIINNPIDKER
jgi:hypothetical protein